jgi:hypothetical protein
MSSQLTLADLEFILTSLDYTRLNFESTQYPTSELKRNQLDRVDTVKSKIRALRDELAGKEPK